METGNRTDGFWRGLALLLLALVLGLVATLFFQIKQPRTVYREVSSNGLQSTMAALTSGDGGGSNVYWVADLAEKSLPFVVNIQSKLKPSERKPDAAQNDDTERMRQMFQQMMPFGGEGFDMRQFQQPSPNEEIVRGEGSGFILNEQGYVVTNSHVVDGGDSFTVRTNDGKEYTAEKVGSDDFKDIAVLKIKESGKFATARLGDSSQTRIGEPVVAIGSPLGLKASVTAGIISTNDRSLSDLGGMSDIRMPQKYLQTDAAINRGNSGGPLLNARGEVIGVNQAIARWDRSPSANNEFGAVPIEGIGFAIPINEVKDTINSIIQHGRVVYPGISAGIVSVKDFLEENERRNVKVDLKVKSGVYVQSVTVNGPAARAGIEANDVILSIDGKAIETGEELISEINKRKVGDRIKLRVARQGGEQQEDVSVVLGELDMTPIKAQLR